MKERAALIINFLFKICCFITQLRYCSIVHDFYSVDINYNEIYYVFITSALLFCFLVVDKWIKSEDKSV